MTNNNMCKERECLEKGPIPFERNNYFCGKLMVDRDFWADQLFHMWKLRKHSSYLHGWGAVCGLEVKPHPHCPNLRVVVEPGFAVDCCGREIFVNQPFEVELGSYKKGNTNDTPKELYVCLSYVECETEPVPLFLDECGCSEATAPNRIRETFAINLLTKDEFAPGELEGYLFDSVQSTSPETITPETKFNELDGTITIKTLNDIFTKDIAADYTGTDKVQKLLDDINGAGLGIKIEYNANQTRFFITSGEQGNIIILMETGDKSFFSGAKLPAYNTQKGNKLIEPCPDCTPPGKIILAQISNYNKVEGDYLDPTHSKYKTQAYDLDNLSYRKVLPRVDRLHKLLIYHTFKK